MTEVMTSENTASPAGSRLYELAGVTRTYSKGNVVVNALRGVDLTINRGEMLVLEGLERIRKNDLVATSRSVGYPLDRTDPLWRSLA